MAFLRQQGSWKWPVELVSEAQKYEQAVRDGMSMEGLRDMIDHWMATIADLHPFTNKAVYGARLDGSEKDIFVDTLLFARPLSSSHTKLEVRDLSTREEIDAEEVVQECYTSIPFYVVSRSWDDGGNPSFTPVSRVCITITPGPTTPDLSVRIQLENGEEAEVTLHEEGGVIFVDPQQGEVAELVMALASCNSLSALKYITTKQLRHESRETQQCQRLFCSCKRFGRQYVNTDMAEFVRCSTTNEKDKIDKLYDWIWHYSMPQYPSLWDMEHVKTCFKFQARLATLCSESRVIVQPECRWNEDLKGMIKIAEDVSLLLGWQRDPREETPTSDAEDRQVVGRIPPGCVMQMTKQAGQSTIETTLAALAAVRRKFVEVEFWGDDGEDDLRCYLDSQANFAPAEVPKRLWNVRTGLRHRGEPGRTKYCAVSYVWEQWEKKSNSGSVALADDGFYSPTEEDEDNSGGKKNKNPMPQPDLERLRRVLLKVADVTRIDLFWVDAKCIIQPGRRGDRDKLKELPKMGDYYGGAAFTIALLPDVTARLKTPVPIPWQVIDADAHRKENSELISQYTRCRWMRRIWTMQEAWLARKLVVMTGGKNGQLIRGDYLELLRASGATIEQYGALPMCLEWFNTGPSLLMGACTGHLITPGETPTLLTRPAGSVLLNDDGTGLQARTTTLQRALRLSNGRSATNPKDTLVGLLGMVDGGRELQVSLGNADGQHNTVAGKSDAQSPERAFILAAKKGMLGPEIMLCGTASTKEGYYWLPRLKDKAASVELPHSSSLVLGGTLEVVTGGIRVHALEVVLIKVKVMNRKTVGTGESAWKYSCRVVIDGRPNTEATIESVKRVKQKKQRVLLLDRSNKWGPFISVRGKPRAGIYYRRKQGFLLTLKGESPQEPLESTLGAQFKDRIIG